MDDIAEWQQKEESERVAELGSRRNEAGNRLMREFGFDDAEHRLIVVDVGNGNAACRRHGIQSRLAQSGGTGRWLKMRCSWSLPFQELMARDLGDLRFAPL